MTSNHYLRLLLAGVALGVTALVGSSIALDHYGLFGHVSGPRQVYRGERTTKYLLAKRYVPEHFDALLLGASISANWNTKLLSAPRLYNASISGGNFSEEKLIADQVLRAGKLKWLVLCAHPYLTMSHGRKTEYMTPREEWSALGSLDLLFAEASKAAVEFGLSHDRHNEFGDSNYDNVARDARRAADAYIAERRRSGKPHPMFKVAPGAVEELQDLVAEAQRKSVRLAVVYPPVYKPRFEAERADWQSYRRRVEAAFPSGTRYLDFNAPEFDAERADFANFQDGAHLRRSYADTLVRRVGLLLED